MTRNYDNGLIIRKERQRCAAIIEKRIKAWEEFIEEFGEDSEVSPLTLVSELEMLWNEITRSRYGEKE